MRRRRIVLAAMIVLVFVAFVALRVTSRRLLFRGRGSVAGRLPSDVRSFVVCAADGAPVHAVELPLPGAPTVVHFHDNRQTVAEALSFGEALRARGLAVVLVEYRGYGASRDLEPSEEALYRDAEAVLDDLARRGIDRAHVVLSGRSLGTGVAAEMARRGRGAALVLVAPYTSIADLVRSAVPFVPAELLIEDAFDTASKSGAIRVPTLVVHGDRDEIVPYAMGRALASSIAHAELLRVDGANHGDVLDREAPRVLASIVALATSACAPAR